MNSQLPSLLKPSLKTKFKVDFDWWQKRDRNWQVYLRSFLCDEHQEVFADYSYTDQIDIVDLETAQVHRVDALLNTIITHCAKQEGFISENSALIDSIFMIYLTNDNQPLTALELSEILHKPADTILRTIGTGKIYKGIRPA